METDSTVKAVDALFSANPVMAAVIVGLTLALIILWRKYDKLTSTLLELVKTNSEAVASITPIVQHVKDDQRSTLAQFIEQSKAQRDEIIRHISTLTGILSAKNE